MKKVAIIAPSGSIENFDDKKVITFFENKNIEAVIFPSCHSNFRYMAGDDNLRVQDIHNAFLDKTIDTIICARGGFGAIRLIDKINYKIIENNKKPFVGFSDITILLISFFKKANLTSFHAPMAVNGVINMNDFEFENYKNEIENNSFKTKLKNGILWGGNLASIVSLFGSINEDYIPDSDIILFLEDINEPDYKIDKMFHQILRNKALSSKVKGIIFGDFTGSGKYLDEIQFEFASFLNVPYEINKNIGHIKNNLILPFGKTF